jgi:hypothetical protein
MRIRSLLSGFLLALSCESAPAFGADSPCPRLDPALKDEDGMPICPSAVEDGTTWAIYRCAISQAKSFHRPTAAEKGSMKELLKAWYQAKQAGGPAKETTKALLTHADALNLQACRVTKEKGKDSYLLVYTKEGVTNYSGPFLMLREREASKVAIISPHDDSDGTYASTKYALHLSKALIVISNGHRRFEKHGVDDFVHSNDNLATSTVAMVADLQKLVWLHIHGMKNDKTALYRSRDERLSRAFEKGVREHSGIRNFNDGFKADFSTDKFMTMLFLKAELPSKLHVNNQKALAGIVREIETNEWAW